ncbi:neuroglobin-like [Denticeps clupeoides]|uniref:neuroglobin-like n=1 Tax=Denticeps clupeoides TaxID=299321 RepID=UPI0010A33FF6|nr:neuroglobin-like [Denticeps clupeoides]
MGCATSDLSGDSRDDAPLVKLTAPQKELIKESWEHVQHDASKTGVIIFVRLFESHPECKNAFFNFREVQDLEMLRVSKELRIHGLRVMSFIEKSVARLNQPERLEQLAFDLGRKHYHYKSIPKYYMLLMMEFIRTIQPILTDCWTTELEEAWKALFLFLTGTMKKGYAEEEKKQKQGVA